MEIDEDKIDDAVLALLWLTLHNELCAFAQGPAFRFFGALFGPILQPGHRRLC